MNKLKIQCRQHSGGKKDCKDIEKDRALHSESMGCRENFFIVLNERVYLNVDKKEALERERLKAQETHSMNKEGVTESSPCAGDPISKQRLQIPSS